MDESDTLPMTGNTFSTTTRRMLSSLKSIRSISRESKNQVTAGPDCRFTLSERPWLSLTHCFSASPTASLLSIFPSLDDTHHILGLASHPLHWYIWWLEEQLKQLPSSISSIVVGHDPLHSNVWTPQLGRIFSEIATFATTSQYPSIDDIVAHILVSGLVEEGKGKNGTLEARSLVFAIIGWQTMLYKPALGTCPPQHLAVIDEQDGYRGQAFMALQQFQGSARRPLHEFLMGFGILLPPSDLCTSTNVEVRKAFTELKTIEPSSFNAFLLNSIGHFKIKWVDVLSCHLEFDERANTIFLFRYPSFCIACGQSGAGEKTSETVIYAAASPSSSSRQWACEEDVTEMLQETLLSYRLLFAQDKQARKLYKRLDPFGGIPLEGRDELLSSLCGRKSFHTPQMPSDQDSYDLQRQFPILRSRIAVLHRLLSASKPRGWRELWRDKRDSAGWFTFWIVLIFGGVAILLSALQVLLQILQIAINR